MSATELQRNRSTAPRTRCSAAAVAVLLLGASLVLGPTAASAGPAVGPAARAACSTTYTVVRGDSWFGISRRVGVSMNGLLDANGATTTSSLMVGATICLPSTAATPPTTTPPTTAPATSTPPSTTQPLPVQLAAFPMQGPCWFADTWLAPRGGGRLHEGVDLIGRAGLYLYAVQDGTLTRQALDRPGSLSGNAWWLTGKDGTYFFYAHLSAFAPGLKVGSRVKAGQVIGFVGRTGSASGNHLHFEIHPRGGRAINPTPVLRAMDACSVTTPPPQPPGISLPPPPTTVPPNTVPPSTVPPNTVPGSTAPAPSIGGAPTAPAAPNVAPSTPRGPGLWQFGAPRSMGEVVVAGQRPSSIRVAGVAGVAGSVSGVIVRLTATSSSAGYLTTYPCDTAPPTASTLSLRAGATVVGSSLVEIAGGSLCLMSNVTVRVKVEVLAVRSSAGVGLQPVSAARVLDTRASTRLGSGVQAQIPLSALGAPGGAQAATISVTVVNPAGAGVLSMGFCGQGPWTVPVGADPVSSFAMVMRVSSSGWCLTSSVPLDVIVDVVGWWAGSRQVTSLDPSRVFDSRSAGGPVGPGGRTVQMAGAAGVPASAGSVVVSVTVVTGSLGTSVFLVPCGQPRSSGTVVAASAQRVTSAVVPVELGGGAVCVSSIHPADVIIDVVGAG